MRDVGAIVPFKGKDHKSRISRRMNADARLEFSLLMLTEVLNALAAAGLGSQCAVVSSCEPALRLARSMGARTVKEESGKGVNKAVLEGMGALKSGTFVVVPADLPWLSETDIRNTLELNALGADVVISPSRAFDGTNLLLFSGKRPVTLSYDADSFWSHFDDAARRRYKVAVYGGRGVMHDIDSVDDLTELTRTGLNTPPANFARRFLGN